MDFCLEWSGFILKAETWFPTPQAVGIDQKLVNKTWNDTPGNNRGITLQTVWSVVLVSFCHSKSSIYYGFQQFRFYNKLFQ